MRYLWSTCLSLFLVLALPMEAEAKRFGGGFSLGKSYTTQKRVAPAPAKQESTTTTAGSTTQTQAPKAGMGGMLGGLLAGGLFAALLFGGSFESLQLMDLLLIGLVIFMLFQLLGRRQPAYAGQGESGPQAVYRQSADTAVSKQPLPTAGISQSGLDAKDVEALDIPEWFDADAFVSEAPKHFELLQGAWDKQNWAEIAEYTSPELLGQLRQNRSVLSEEQHTEVVSVMAELVGFQQQQTEIVASVHFHGWIRENGNNETTEFSEVWHLSRVVGESGNAWVIVGIDQPE